jgi:hypothetical protein
MRPLANFATVKVVRRVSMTMPLCSSWVASERVDSTTVKDLVTGFVHDAKGLIVDVSLKGAKFMKINK